MPNKCRQTRSINGSIGTGLHINAGVAQQTFYLAANLLAMLQGAGRMISHPLRKFPLQFLLQLALECWQNFAQIFGQRRNGFVLDRIHRIMRQQMAVFLDRGAAYCPVRRPDRSGDSGSHHSSRP